MKWSPVVLVIDSAILIGFKYVVISFNFGNMKERKDIYIELQQKSNVNYSTGKVRPMRAAFD